MAASLPLENNSWLGSSCLHLKLSKGGGDEDDVCHKHKIKIVYDTFLAIQQVIGQWTKSINKDDSNTSETTSK